MKRTSILFSLWTLQGMATLLWLVILPTNSENGVVFGFSISRILLISMAFLLMGISGCLFWIQRNSNYSFPPMQIQALQILSVAIFTFSPIVIIVLRALGESYAYYLSAYATRLTPLAAWFTLSSLELIILLTAENRTNDELLPVKKQYFRLTFLILTISTLIVVFIAATKLGITRSNDGSWGYPTTPLLEWQIALALFFSLAFMFLQRRWHWLKQDKIICLLVYLFTCMLWLSQPVNPGFFATSPRAPNFEIYPFSDALIYAQYAQSALIGNGFMWPDVPTRPLYITLLTWIHAAAGQDYNHIIALQTIILASFPVIIYLLGKELSGRPLGLGLAMLVALRDVTANIAAPFALNYTYTKLFFSEIPAALLIALFTLIIIRWMRKSQPIWIPLMAGGLLGLSSLIRLQSAILLVGVIPFGFFIVSNKKKWLLGSVFLVFGVILALIPWLARNYKASGGIILDNPISQTMVLARRWGGSNGNELIPHLPGEGDAQYSNRMSTLALGSLRADPYRIITSAVNHFFNNQIDSLLVFPLRDKLESPQELLWPTRAFWQTWGGHPSAGQIPVMALYLLFFCAGLAAAVQKNGLVGWLPLGLNLVYNAWTALFLSSGDRFLVPVDWAIYLYQFLGIFTLAALAISGKIWDLIPAPSEEKSISYSLRASGVKILISVFIILLLGSSIPLTEVIFPQRITSQLKQPANTTAGQVTLNGRAIYPRWYDSNDGEPGTAKLGYGKSDQARLVFFLTGEKNTLVIFPIENAPQFFPNASDVSITGEFEEGYLLAQRISIFKGGRSVQYIP